MHSLLRLAADLSAVASATKRFFRLYSETKCADLSVVCIGLFRFTPSKERSKGFMKLVEGRVYSTVIEETDQISRILQLCFRKSSLSMTLYMQITGQSQCETDEGCGEYLNSFDENGTDIGRKVTMTKMLINQILTHIFLYLPWLTSQRCYLSLTLILYSNIYT
jgi:hypothetical protein